MRSWHRGAVGQPGEGVVHVGVAQLVLHGLLLGDVAHAATHAQAPAVVVLDHAADDREPMHAAVVAEEPDVDALALEIAPAGEDAAPQAYVVAVDDALHEVRVIHERLGRIAGDAQARRRHVEHDAVGIAPGLHVEGRVGHGAVAFFRQAQRLLHALALDGHGHLFGNGHHQVDVGLRVVLGVVIVLHGHGADGVAAGLEGHAQPYLGGGAHHAKIVGLDFHAAAHVQLVLADDERPSHSDDVQSQAFGLRIRDALYAIEFLVHLVGEIFEVQPVALGVHQGDEKIRGVDELAQDAVDGGIQLVQVVGGVHGVGNAKENGQQHLVAVQELLVAHARGDVLLKADEMRHFVAFQAKGHVRRRYPAVQPVAPGPVDAPAPGAPGSQLVHGHAHAVDVLAVHAQVRDVAVALALFVALCALFAKRRVGVDDHTPNVGDQGRHGKRIEHLAKQPRRAVPQGRAFQCCQLLAGRCRHVSPPVAPRKRSPGYESLQEV